MEAPEIPSEEQAPATCDAVVHLQWTLALDWRTVLGADGVDGNPLLPDWKDRATSWRDGQEGTDVWVESLEPSQAPSWSALQRAHIAAGLDPQFRTGPATSGDRHYGWYQDLEKRMVRKLDVDGQNDVSAMARAIRGFLDIIHTHPFEDGNTRAACTWLVWSMVGAGLNIPDLSQLIALPKLPADDDVVMQMAELLSA